MCTSRSDVAALAAAAASATDSGSLGFQQSPQERADYVLAVFVEHLADDADVRDLVLQVGFELLPELRASRVADVPHDPSSCSDLAGSVAAEVTKVEPVVRVSVADARDEGFAGDEARAMGRHEDEIRGDAQFEGDIGAGGHD
jgi:hypothetical protein